MALFTYLAWHMAALKIQPMTWQQSARAGMSEVNFIEAPCIKGASIVMPSTRQNTVHRIDAPFHWTPVNIKKMCALGGIDSVPGALPGGHRYLARCELHPQGDQLLQA
jgi:hypothetical protein